MTGSRGEVAPPRAFAEADAAGGEAKRIIAAARTSTHQPYRDPDDQTGYHGAIA